MFASLLSPVEPKAHFGSALLQRNPLQKYKMSFLFTMPFWLKKTFYNYYRWRTLDHERKLLDSQRHFFNEDMAAATPVLKWAHFNVKAIWRYSFIMALTSIYKHHRCCFSKNLTLISAETTVLVFHKFT